MRKEMISGKARVWLPSMKRVYRVDINSNLFHYLDEKCLVHIVKTPEIITFLYPDPSSALMGTLKSSFVRIDLVIDSITKLISLNLPERIRFNDGKCDRYGNYRAGTLDINDEDPIVKLYFLDRNKNLTELLSGLTISNGLC
ncbi:MAG: SMP-30/gluconolactonase/LRE family protein [Conexivisphaerales archaeon]